MRPLIRDLLSASLFAAFAAIPASLAAQDQKLEVVRLADSVYASIYSEMNYDPVESNSMFIITSAGVIVVDASYTPAGARATIAEIKKRTKLPVRYVIATHWHDDHVFGNEAYRAAYPGVQFIGHAEMRESLRKGGAQHQQELVAGYTKNVPAVEARLASGVEGDGKPFTPARRAEITRALEVYRAFLKKITGVQVILPDITFQKKLVLHLGGREIQILNFGNGNTRGDAVIWLPQEKLVSVGDLVVWPVPFIFGGFPAEWSGIMDSVKALGASAIVPGHGPVFRDMEYIDTEIALLQSLAKQAKDAVKRGLTVEEFRKGIDLEAFHTKLVQGDKYREDTWRDSILQAGIASAYKEAKGKGED